MQHTTYNTLHTTHYITFKINPKNFPANKNKFCHLTAARKNVYVRSCFSRNNAFLHFALLKILHKHAQAIQQTPLGFCVHKKQTKPKSMFEIFFNFTGSPVVLNWGAIYNTQGYRELICLSKYH